MKSLLQQGQEGKAKEPLAFEELLWKAAEVLRGSMDVTDYKHVILGLFFLKYLTDAFEQYREILYAEMAADPIAGAWVDELLDLPEQYTDQGVFWVPPEARWGYLRERVTQPKMGELLDSAMDLIELNNPRLRGMLPKVYARLGLETQKFGELVDLINGIGPGAVGGCARDILARMRS